MIIGLLASLLSAKRRRSVKVEATSFCTAELMIMLSPCLALRSFAFDRSSLPAYISEIWDVAATPSAKAIYVFQSKFAHICQALRGRHGVCVSKVSFVILDLRIVSHAP